MALERAGTQGLVQRLFPAGSPQRLELLRAAWPLAVGADLARRTEVLALEGRTLRVRVPDAGWLKVIHRLRGQILSRLQRVAGEAAPERLGLQAAPMGAVVRTPDVPAPAPAPAPAAAPAAVAAQAETIADPELRRAFLEVAARYLDRARGRTEPRETEHA